MSAAFQAANAPGFFMVRGVSDLADEKKDTPNVRRWRTYACDVSATFLVEMLERGPVPILQSATSNRGVVAGRRDSPAISTKTPKRNAKAFSERLAKQLGCQLLFDTNVDKARDFAIFSLDLTTIALRGFEEPVACATLLSIGSELQQRWRKEILDKRLALVFCLHEDAYEWARSNGHAGRTVVLSAGELAELMDSRSPQDHLKKAIRNCIPRRRLNPYSITRSACPAIFIGRTKELAFLAEDESTSFAVAGPSQIGKTSLLLQHRRQLLKTGDPRIHRTTYIDLFHQPQEPDKLARNIALAVAAPRLARHAHHVGLVKLFERMSQRESGCIHLLIDEVGNYLDNPVMIMLGHAAKSGFVRLILAGRKALHQFTRSSKYVLGLRLKLLVPSPLTHDEVAELITCPMRDLGIEVVDQVDVTEWICQMSPDVGWFAPFCAIPL